MLATDLLAMYREEKAVYIESSFPSFTEWKKQENVEFDNKEDEKEYFELYREERESIVGKFQSFAEWKRTYDCEWNSAHCSSSFVTYDFAMEITEAEILSFKALALLESEVDNDSE